MLDIIKGVKIITEKTCYITKNIFIIIEAENEPVGLFYMELTQIR